MKTCMACAQVACFGRLCGQCAEELRSPTNDQPLYSVGQDAAAEDRAQGVDMETPEEILRVNLHDWLAGSWERDPTVSELDEVVRGYLARRMLDDMVERVEIAIDRAQLEGTDP